MYHMAGQANPNILRANPATPFPPVKMANDGQPLPPPRRVGMRPTQPAQSGADVLTKQPPPPPPQQQQPAWFSAGRFNPYAGRQFTAPPLNWQQRQAQPSGPPAQPLNWQQQQVQQMPVQSRRMYNGLPPGEPAKTLMPAQAPITQRGQPVGSRVNLQQRQFAGALPPQPQLPNGRF